MFWIQAEDSWGWHTSDRGDAGNECIIPTLVKEYDFTRDTTGIRSIGKSCYCSNIDSNIENQSIQLKKKSTNLKKNNNNNSLNVMS